MDQHSDQVPLILRKMYVKKKFTDMSHGHGLAGTKNHAFSLTGDSTGVVLSNDIQLVRPHCT